MSIAVQKPVIPDFISLKFRFWSFVSMFLLVFVHGYNLKHNYLQPWTLPEEPVTFTTFTEYLLANGLFRFRIPLLFLISGFLYAFNDYRPYKQRTIKRLRTLLLPYLIWSATGIIFTWLLELNSVGQQVVAQSHLVQIDETRTLLHNYKWYELLFRWIFLPVPYQLWFIRVLLIYNLAYPWIKAAISHKVARYFFWSVAVMLWLTTSGFVFFEGEGLLFFSLGIWMQKSSFNLSGAPLQLHPLTWVAVFLITSVIKTLIAFNPHFLPQAAIFPVLSLLHKVLIVSGLVAVWYATDSLVSWCMNQRFFRWISSFSFIIYAFHAPLIAYAMAWILPIAVDFPLYRLITFITLPLLIISMAVALGASLRRFTPSFYSLLTGGRGF